MNMNYYNWMEVEMRRLAPGEDTDLQRHYIKLGLESGLKYALDRVAYVKSTCVIRDDETTKGFYKAINNIEELLKKI